MTKTRQRDLHIAPAFCTLMVNYKHGLQNWTLSDGQTDSNHELFSPDDIKDLISKLELLAKLPTTFLDSLDDKDRVICFRATLLCYYATGQGWHKNPM